MSSRRTVPRICQQCGDDFMAKPDQVRYGKAKYCGVLCQSAATSVRKTVHGEEARSARLHPEYMRSPEYNAWRSIKSRCLNPLDKSYASYGGRGIVICEDWQASFQKFLAHIGRRPTARHSIDRINNEGNYEPGNVRWSTPPEQMRNRRVTRFLTLNGTTLCLSDWATHLGIGKTTLCARLKAGWSVERSLTTPLAAKQ